MCVYVCRCWKLRHIYTSADIISKLYVYIFSDPSLIDIHMYTRERWLYIYVYIYIYILLYVYKGDSLKTMETIRFGLSAQGIIKQNLTINKQHNHTTKMSPGITPNNHIITL